MPSVAHSVLVTFFQFQLLNLIAHRGHRPSTDEAQSTAASAPVVNSDGRRAARCRGRRTEWIRQVDGRSAQKERLFQEP
jgi:hypothetical protein